ncbi:thioredoxin-like protein [Scleroderma yunnanense]
MSTPTNSHSVTSVEHFQDLLKQDLHRVALIYFWAPWAEPCKQMNDVVDELAKKHSTLLVLQVEAEELSDISESFNIQSVPSFLLLRGHTLLDRVEGANATALTESVAKHISTLPSNSTQPSPSESTVASSPPSSEETKEQLHERIRKLLKQSKVVLFMKGSPDVPRCGFSRKIVALLREKEVVFTHFDILTDVAIRQELKAYNNWPTYPQLIVNGELVGGLDIVQEMAENGELKELVA